MPIGAYRVLVIYEDSSANRKSYKVDLDGEPIGELGEKSLIMTNTEFGWHSIDFSSNWGVEKTTKFSIEKDQYITRVFVHNNFRNKVETRVDSGESAQMAAILKGGPAPQRESEPDYVYVPEPASRQKTGASSRRGRFWPLLIGFLVGIICTCGFFLLINPGAVTATAPARGTVQPARTAQPSESPEQASKTLPFYLPAGGRGSGALGGFDVEIKEGSLARSAAGDPAIVITYSWTNNSGVTVSAAEVMTELAFQNGVQLDPADMGDDPSYDFEMRRRNVRPGRTIDVQTAFALTSQTAPVEFELSEAPGSSEDIVSMNFDLMGVR